jgi:mycothione reductase
VTAVESLDDGGKRVHAETADGDTVAVDAADVLVALGRRPNTDDLGLENTSVETEDRGFVETNEHLETTADGVWAQGDVAGNALFKHSGDYETQHTIRNVVHGERVTVDMSAMPHVIFTDPHWASALVREGVVAMRNDLTVRDVANTIHAHPTLNKVVQAAFEDATD